MINITILPKNPNLDAKRLESLHKKLSDFLLEFNKDYSVFLRSELIENINSVIRDIIVENDKIIKFIQKQNDVLKECINIL
ncbi:MAG: hypothetical protein ACRCYT_06330 [Cetobacterium sp.]